MKMLEIYLEDFCRQFNGRFDEYDGKYYFMDFHISINSWNGKINFIDLFNTRDFSVFENCLKRFIKALYSFNDYGTQIEFVKFVKDEKNDN